jgi:transketolase
VATGSLGQGLPYGVGIALAGRRLGKLPYQVWVPCGDSEMAGGPMYALVALGTRPDVVALDGEVGNSTDAWEFAAAFPDRFFEMFIAEQQLIAAAVGLAVRGYVPFACTFAAFLSRGYDFLRMAGISGASIRLCGSHAGTEIGPDGPSQMALEDLAAPRAIHGSTVLYPAEATATAALTAEMADTPGIVYLRTTRGAWPVL